MKKRVALALAAGFAVAANAQEASTFKVYGFADATLAYTQINGDFAKQFIGGDTLTLNLEHANLYFDFKPNDRIKGLVEVGFFSRPTYTRYTGGSDPSVITYQGQVLSDDQIKSIVTEQKLAAQVASLVPAGTPQAQIDALKNTYRPIVAAAVNDSLQPKLTALRSKVAGTAVEDRRELTVARAQFDLMLNDRFNLRMGKFITPAGVWNVDHASPVILAVRQPIQTTTVPIFPESQMGLMGYGNVPLGDQDLNYCGYVTSGRIDGSSTLLDANEGAALNSLGDLAYGGHLGLKLDLLKSIQLGASYFNGAVNQKYSATELRFELADLLTESPTSMGVNDHYLAKQREWAVGGDAKIEVSNLLLQGEVNYRHREDELSDGSSDVTGWYSLAAWSQPVNASISITPYAMFERVALDFSGTAKNTSGLKGFHNISLGVNAAFFTNYHLKMEYMNTQLEKSDDAWPFTGVTADDLNFGTWSTQIAVAF